MPTGRYPLVFKHRLRPVSAFTLIEVLIALGIFMMVLIAVYATWSAILRGTRAGTAAAADIQRSRMAMRTIEDALLTAVSFTANARYYEFVAEHSGDFA